MFHPWRKADQCLEWRLDGPTRSRYSGAKILVRRIRVGRDPDDVPRATTRSIGAHPDLIHAEPDLAKSLGEIPIWS
jgi:hypothetical protein